MKTSELIAALEAAKARFGDLEVRGTWEGITTPINAIYRDRDGRLLIDNDSENVGTGDHYRKEQENPEDR